MKYRSIPIVSAIICTEAAEGSSVLVGEGEGGGKISQIDTHKLDISTLNIQCHQLLL